MLGYDIYLNRYLFVFRVNRSLVRFPNLPAPEFSLILGAAITDRLPTMQARPWHKSLSSWDEYFGCEKGGWHSPPHWPLVPPGQKKQRKKKQTSRNKGNRRKKGPPMEVPESPWPIETVFFFHPSKRTYGQDELIFWELRLMGESADHGLFLEVILPAWEELGCRSDSRWRYANCLWGRFDIDSVYMARGLRWEPVVKNGKLDLTYKASASQWRKGLKFDGRNRKTVASLRWMTPFDFRNKEGQDEAPTLRRILEGFAERVALLTLGKYYDLNKFCDLLGTEDQSALVDALELASRIPIVRHDFKPVEPACPGRWTGNQSFSTSIPDSLIPYIGLASIFHTGRHTHFGCGTFVID